MKMFVTLALVLSLASSAFAQQPAPQPGPQPPTCVAPLVIDYTSLLKEIVETQQEQLVIEKDTNAQVSSINKTFAQTMGQVGAFVGKYVAPAIVAYIAAKKL